MPNTPKTARILYKVDRNFEIVSSLLWLSTVGIIYIFKFSRITEITHRVFLFISNCIQKTGRKRISFNFLMKQQL